jgi:hypothetical protein
LQIVNIINITDVSLTSVVSIYNTNINSLSYTLITDSGIVTNNPINSLNSISRDSNNNLLIPIIGLTPNNNYTNFQFKAYYEGSSFGNGITKGINLNSNNLFFSTLGLNVNLNNYITDTSATIFFSYNPNIINVNYYYDFSYSSNNYTPTTSSKFFIQSINTILII